MEYFLVKCKTSDTKYLVLGEEILGAMTGEFIVGQILQTSVGGFGWSEYVSDRRWVFDNHTYRKLEKADNSINLPDGFRFADGEK